MHVLFQNPKTELPIIVNEDSRDCFELKMAGYTEVQRGHKKTLQDLEREILEGMCEGLELNDIN